MNPDRKVLVGAFAGGWVAVLAWVLKTFYSVEFSADAAIGLTTVLTFVVQYVVPNKELSNDEDSGV
jgi:hypothetical protein